MAKKPDAEPKKGTAPPKKEEKKEWTPYIGDNNAAGQESGQGPPD